VLRNSRGFTLVELAVVLAITGIAMVLVAVYQRSYIDGARFSNLVRTFHNTLNEARIKAVGNQATIRLIPRPLDSFTTEPAEWKYSTSYALDQVVMRQGLAYRCIAGHTSDASSTTTVNRILGRWFEVTKSEETIIDTT